MIRGMRIMLRGTPTREDYLEMIYVLIKEKGYATTIGIASHLNVKSPAVTVMMQRLDKDGFVVYEKYRGVKLTPKGERIGKFIIDRHKTISRFLRILGVDEETAQKDTEAIEHIIDEETMSCISQFLKFAEENPKWIEKYPPFKKNYEEIAKHNKKEPMASDLKYAHEMQRSHPDSQ
jgi:Mn-dependent DtxR family transcriptional regulator